MSLYLSSCRRRLQVTTLTPIRCPSGEFHASSRQRPIHNLKWYGLGAIGASALGFSLWHSNNSLRSNFTPLSSEYFTPAALKNSAKTNENAKLLRLVLPPTTLKNMSSFDFQPIWSVFVKDSDIQVERPYTPLEGLSQNGEMIFWIKKYEHGEVGRWLHNRSEGEQVEIRGPVQTWTWKDGTWDNVIMVAGGTGIAPFYQLLHTLLTNPSRSTKTKFTLLQSYCSPEELPPSTILERLSFWERGNPEKLKIGTFVDVQNNDVRDCDLRVGRITKHDLESALKASKGRTIVLICGPDPMIAALAGPKGRDQSQGHLGGALGALYNGTFSVWKL